MKAVETLERQLHDYWRHLETRKSWTQWLQWLQGLGMLPPSLAKRPGGSEHLLTYQEFLGLSEEDLKPHPAWLQKLMTPQWLHTQHLMVLPSAWNTPKAASLEVPSPQQLVQMMRDLQNLKERFALMEQKLTTLQSLPSPESLPSRLPHYGHTLSEEEGPAAPRISLEKAQSLDKELVLRQHSQKPKPAKPQEPQANQAKPKRLDEVYLSFNEWCDEFALRGLDLQPFSSESIKVPSSHRISFNQFGHRMERKVSDTIGFRKTWERFQAMFHQGFMPQSSTLVTASPEGLAENTLAVDDVAFPEAEQESTASSVHSDQTLRAAFTPPAADVYMEFNQWLEWLRQEGIDATRYSAQELPVISSHRISFIQFCKRLERKLDDIAGFRQALGVEF